MTTSNFLNFLMEWFDNLPNRVRQAAPFAVALLFTLAIIACYKTFIGSHHPYLVGLFPVMICSLFLRAAPSLVSLVVTAAFINVFDVNPAHLQDQILTTSIFLAEGVIVIWIASSRRKVHLQLLAVLKDRSQELEELETAHYKIAKTERERNREDPTRSRKPA